MTKFEFLDYRVRWGKHSTILAAYLTATALLGLQCQVMRGLDIRPSHVREETIHRKIEQGCLRLFCTILAPQSAASTTAA